MDPLQLASVVEPAATELSLPVQGPRGWILKVLADILVSDRNLHGTREGDDQQVKAFSSEHRPQRRLGVVTTCS
jgi:hypothetical protein